MLKTYPKNVKKTMYWIIVCDVVFGFGCLIGVNVL